MRKIEKEKKVVEVDKITDILCNKCDKSVCPESKNLKWSEGCNIRIGFKYGSNRDGEVHKFDLCDNCYDEFIKSFKHQPAINHVSFL